jgi:hypothetical protein
MFADGGIYSGATTLGSPAVPTLAAGQGVDIPSLGKMIGGMKPGGGKEEEAPSTIIAAKSGGKVPGKSKVKDDSLKNDTVPAMLSAGEIVIPRHITMHPDAPEKAAAFVRAILAKKGLKK